MPETVAKKTPIFAIASSLRWARKKGHAKDNKKKLKELPQNFVIFATTSQIVNNIGEGLRGIKKKNTGQIPTNITTIKNFEPKEGTKDFMSYGSSAKNLYLLLLEDL